MAKTAWDDLYDKYPRSQPYETYKLVWMLQHGYSIPRLIRELQRVQEEAAEDGDSVSVEEVYKRWEEDVGFGSNIWACFEEWKLYEGSNVQ